MKKEFTGPRSHKGRETLSSILHTIPRYVCRGYSWTVLHNTSRWRSQRNVLCHLDGVVKTMRWTKRLLVGMRFDYHTEWAYSSRAFAQAGYSTVLKCESYMHNLGGICDLRHVAVEIASSTYCNRLALLHIHFDFYSNIHPTSTDAQRLFAHSLVALINRFLWNVSTYLSDHTMSQSRRITIVTAVRNPNYTLGLSFAAPEVGGGWMENNRRWMKNNRRWLKNNCRSWRLRDVIASCWYVPWLQEGCQDRLTGSASMDCRGCRKVVKSGWQVVRPWMGS